MHAPKLIKGEWVYPHFANVLQAAGLGTLEHYINKRRHTIANTIRGRSILDECRGAERATSIPRHLNWWQQRLNYSGEEEDGEAGTMEELNSTVSPTF